MISLRLHLSTSQHPQTFPSPRLLLMNSPRTTLKGSRMPRRAVTKRTLPTSPDQASMTSTLSSTTAHPPVKLRAIQQHSATRAASTLSLPVPPAPPKPPHPALSRTLPSLMTGMPSSRASTPLVQLPRPPSSRSLPAHRLPSPLQRVQSSSQTMTPS